MDGSVAERIAECRFLLRQSDLCFASSLSDNVETAQSYPNYPDAMNALLLHGKRINAERVPLPFRRSERRSRFNTEEGTCTVQCRWGGRSAETASSLTVAHSTHARTRPVGQSLRQALPPTLYALHCNCRQAMPDQSVISDDSPERRQPVPSDPLSSSARINSNSNT